MKHPNLITAAVAAATLAAPGAAWACGGLFCDTSQPVVQAAERILFARDGGTIHMQVQIAYDGPPQRFGWLLPTMPGVEDALGSEELFRQLDLQFGPRFSLQTEFDESCDDRQFAAPTAADGDSAEGGGTANAGGRGGVQVLSREAIGPYDRAILAVDGMGEEGVALLRDWLDTNEYQIPEITDSVLQPYIDDGFHFIAIKLLPGNDAGDIAPLHLKFDGPDPCVPIRPTAVAADPDMGIIVHVLGEHRAIPKNYAHVEINEAAIDWVGGGQNYQDVVSQAADEADGQAFTTDYAGEGGPALIELLPVFTDDQLQVIESAETFRDVLRALNVEFGTADADLVRVLGSAIELTDDIDVDQFFSCPDCWNVDLDQPVDGAAIAAQIGAEVNPARETIADLADRFPYLTRLFTTMSAHEMTRDPTFSHNPDIEGVSRTRTAVRTISCDEAGERFDTAVITTPSGLRFRLVDGQNPNVIRRSAGETVDGADEFGAQVIAMIGESGAPVIEEDRSALLAERYGSGISEGAGSGDGEVGCLCDAGDSHGGSIWLGLVALLGLARPRRRRVH
jgi:hypothetical protein